MSPVLMLLALAGCLPELEVPPIPSNPNHDFDLDGYNEQEGDCNDEDPGIGLPFDWYQDSDHDGFGIGEAESSCDEPENGASASGDCDDADAAAFPGAEETCDGADNDCDGDVDAEDADLSTLWYVDADDDGFGDETSGVATCEPQSGWIEAGGDCDDTDATVHPGAAEADCADPVDRDCDGSTPLYADVDGDEVAACVDCDDTDAAVGMDVLWYEDTDGDGFGDPSVSQNVCEAPSGYVAAGTDCDDADPDVNPDVLWYTDVDGDGYGDEAAAVASCTPVADAVAVGGDCDDADDTIHPGAAEPDCADPTDYNCDGSTGFADGDKDGVPACDDCDDADASSTYGDPWYADADGDTYGDADASTIACDAPAGHVADDADCDDTDPDVNPDTLWYEDTDGDGYGDASAPMASCLAPADHVADATDCGVADPAVHPGAPELDCADPVDYDCDGSVAYADADGDGVAACEDCNDADASVFGSPWYRDADGDTYGDAAVAKTSCLAPSGYVSSSTDCDDTNAAVRPGATETCDSADLDEDCDGKADDLDAPVSGKSTWYVDVDGDGWGATTPTKSACDLPAGYVANDDDCDDTDDTSYPGAYCPITGGTWALATTPGAAKIQGSGWNTLGMSVANGGDLDDDGDDDLLIGAGYTGGGQIGYALSVTRTPSGATPGATAATARFTGRSGSDGAGVRVAGGGDVDGDGLSEWLVGAPYDDDAYSQAGAVYLLEGELTGSLTYANATAIFQGAGATRYAGLGAAMATDISGDGVDDMLISAFYEPDPATGNVEVGAWFVMEGVWSGDVALTSTNAWATWLGYGDNERCGLDGDDIGDFDGDGLHDLALGCHRFQIYPNTPGATYLMLAPFSPGANYLASVGVRYTGDTSQSIEELGTRVERAGDVDADGYDDLLLGAPGNDVVSSDAGAVYLLYGSSAPVAAEIDDAAGTVFHGTTTGSNLYPSLGELDVDSDGAIDVLVSEPNYPANKVYLYLAPGLGTYLGADADWTLTSSAYNTGLGTSMATIGDVDGLGGDDLWIGEPGVDGSVGGVHLFYSGSL